MFGAHLIIGTVAESETPGAVEFLATATDTAPLTLPAHLAGDLFLAVRGQTASGNNTVSSPWFDVFTPVSDTDGIPSSFQVARGIAATDNSLTYPLTGDITRRHMYWHFRDAVVGAQVAVNSGGSGTAVTVPSLSGLATTSWVVAGFHSRDAQTTTDLDLLVPAGYTMRRRAGGSANSWIMFDSNGPIGITTFAGDSATMTSQTNGWCGWAAEIAVA